MANAEYSQVLPTDKLLENEDDSDQESQAPRPKARPLTRGHARTQLEHFMKNNFHKITFFNGIMLVANLALASILMSGIWYQSRDKILMYSPLSGLIKNEIQAFKTDEDHMWTGPPNPVTEQNWHEFLQGFDVRVSKGDMQKLGRLENAVEVSDEQGGYVALLNVFHELHCLKLIRWSLYPDYFYPNSSAADAEEREKHRDHCINYIRQSAMCHADIGLSTWHWRPNDPMPHADMMPHTCRNWAAIDAWAKDHKVDMYQPSLLVHPKFGPAFPDGGGANEDDGSA